MDFLDENNIPFAIRLKEDMTVSLANGMTWSFRTLMRHKRVGAKAQWEGRLNGTSGATSQPLRIAAKRLANQQVLIVATNQSDAAQTLKRMGEGIKGQLQQSIRDFDEVPLARSTVARKGNDKQLIDTGHMVNSADYEVTGT